MYRGSMSKEDSLKRAEAWRLFSQTPRLAMSSGEQQQRGCMKRGPQPPLQKYAKQEEVKGRHRVGCIKRTMPLSIRY
jgi:hypothetical protein